MKDKKENEFKGSTPFTTELLAPNSKLGQDLIKEAFKEVQEQNKKQVIGHVKTIMDRIQFMIRLQSKTERRLDLLRKQAKAIESGEFTIESKWTGVPGSEQTAIRFNDIELNTTWDETERW